MVEKRHGISGICHSRIVRIEYRTYQQSVFKKKRMDHQEQAADTFSDVRGKEFRDTKNRTTLARLKHETALYFFELRRNLHFPIVIFRAAFDAVLCRIVTCIHLCIIRTFNYILF